MQTATEVYADSSYAYVAGGSEGLRIIDVSDPYNPIESGYYDTGGLGLAVSINEAYTYLADGEDGLYVIKNDLITTVDDNKINTFPEDFVLFQNYPNPFNPVTSIQYAVNSRQFITLKVYDILGNEIETLVNEEKPAGTFEVTWYAEGLPSGVYFYQLKAGSFIETKKMVLLR